MYMETLFFLIVLIFSVVIHEVSHGVVADRLGDSTARRAGRLTLNPLKHLDPVGSFVVPLLSLWFAGFVFGWAKPVPYNPEALRDPKKAAGQIAAAGPLSNFALALVFGFLIRIAAIPFFSWLAPMLPLFSVIVAVNVVLGVFNLVPIPPLDGSKVLFAFLPRTENGLRLVYFLERYGIFLVLLFILAGFSIITPIIDALFRLFTGHPMIL